MSSRISPSAPKPADRATRRRPEALVLFAACLLTVVSIYFTTTAGDVAYAGFPYHFITFYNLAGINRSADFWSRLAPQWNVNGMIFVNIVFYYCVIVIARAVVTKLVGRR